MNQFDVVVSAGSLRSNDAHAIQFPHRWTSEGVTVDAAFSGAHLLHLAAAGCVLNDIYREAAAFGFQVDGVRVSAAGGFAVEAGHRGAWRDLPERYGPWQTCYERLRRWQADGTWHACSRTPRPSPMRSGRSTGRWSWTRPSCGPHQHTAGARKGGAAAT
jgi:hypothetical protein